MNKAETLSPVSKKLKVDGEDNNKTETMTTTRTTTRNTTTSIASKVNNFKKQIEEKQQQILKTNQQVDQKTKEVEAEEKQGLGNSVESLKGLMALKDQLMALEKKLSALEKELSALEKKWIAGTYFGVLGDYWKEESVNIESNGVYKSIKWTNYQRSVDQVANIQVRKYSSKKGLYTDNPYQISKDGAIDSSTGILGSENARTNPSSQGKKLERDRLWPSDIFGNKADDQEIAHLMPAGTQDHKEWMWVAAAVIGINQEEASSETLKKAVRGFKKCQEKQGREPGTGIVHFVSNKLRMSMQKRYFDGNDPIGLCIPVMDLIKAREWKGEAYSALFVLGLPDDNQRLKTDYHIQYKNVGLDREEVLKCNTIRDATDDEIDAARMTLICAVVALRNLVAEMDENQIKNLGLKCHGDGLKQAQVYARKPECILPQKFEPLTHPKPLCLVKFGGANEEGKHPAPDPLLLAYKAACIWAKMTQKFRLLANGEKFDPYESMSEDEYFVEMAFPESCSGFCSPHGWGDLATGLGQPNGFQE